MRTEIATSIEDLAFPSIAGYLDQERRQGQGANAVNPPSADYPLRQEPDHHNAREITAGDGLGGVGAKRGAPDGVGNPSLGLCERVHDRNGKDCQNEAGRRELLSRSPPQAPGSTHYDIDSKRDEQESAELSGHPFRCLGEFLALAQLDT